MKGESAKVVIALLLLVCIITGWRWYAIQQKFNDSETQLAAMEAHAQSLERRVFELEGELAKAKESSVQGLLEGANKTIFGEWESLLKEFNDRLDEARKELLEETEQESENENDDRT